MITRSSEGLRCNDHERSFAEQVQDRIGEDEEEMPKSVFLAVCSIGRFLYFAGDLQKRARGRLFPCNAHNSFAWKPGVQVCPLYVAPCVARPVDREVPGWIGACALAHGQPAHAEPRQVSSRGPIWRYSTKHA